MRKKGFVFMETIMVLIVVAVALAALLASYSILQRKSRQAETYDKVSDKYLLYAIATLGNTSGTAYLSSDNFTLTENMCDTFTNPGETHPMAQVITEKECKGVFADYNLKYLYKINNVEEILKSSYRDKDGKSTTQIYDNGSLEYIKTLQKKETTILDNGTITEKPIQYIVGVFYRNEKYYFTSVKL